MSQMTMKLIDVPQNNTFKTSKFANMLDTLFGWRKATKCKEMINSLRHRLMALRRQRNAISEQLREDIALFSMNAQQHFVFTKIEELYVNEGLIEVYEWLDNYCEFVLMNLPYIKRHRNCTKDLNEAVSTLVFASEWLGDLPELKAISKLFKERYGCKFMKMAMELLPGNLVNPHVKEKLCMKSVPEDENKRLLHEITQEYLDPADFIEIECSCPPPQQPTFQETVSKSGTANVDLRTHDETVDDNVEEFKSPAKKGTHFVDDQDQRVFIYTPLKTQNADKHPKTKPSRTTQRRRSSSSCNYKPLNDEVEFEVFYSNSPKLARDEFVPSFRTWLEDEETEMQPRCRNLSRKRVSYSGRHVQVKLPNCDELEAMFMALKQIQIHQQSTF